MAKTENTKKRRTQPAKGSPSKIKTLWVWLSVGKHLAIIALIISVIALAVSATWQLYIHLSTKETPQITPHQVTVLNGRVAVGGDMTAIAEPGGTAIAPAGNVFIGITLEQHESSLKRREQELRIELTSDHRLNRATIESELTAITEKLNNLKKSYEERIVFLQGQIASLEKLTGEVPEKLLEAAEAALIQGDTSKASALFQQVEDRAGNLAAVATFLNGSIAEDKIDYGVAFTKYQRAAQLQPSNDAYQVFAGRMARTLGLYDMAIEYYESALRLYESEEDDESFNVARVWNYLGSTWQIKADYDKAIDYHEKALKVHRANFGEARSLVAGDFGYLGAAWHGKGDVNKALYYSEKALKLLIATLGEAHQNVSVAWNNLGNIWADIGYYDHAIRYYEKSLKIDLVLFNESHPYVASSWNNLGIAWAHKGEHDKAIGYYDQALKVRIAVFDEAHPAVAECWTNLGSAWEEKGDFEKAIGYYEQSLEVWKQRFGKEHPNTQKTRTALERVREAIISGGSLCNKGIKGPPISRLLSSGQTIP